MLKKTNYNSERSNNNRSNIPNGYRAPTFTGLVRAVQWNILSHSTYSSRKPYSTNISFQSIRIASSSTLIGTDSLWITGGLNDHFHFLDSSEVLQDGVWTTGPDLPEPMAFHCSVRLNETHTLLIGHSARTWIYDWTKNKWTEEGM